MDLNKIQRSFLESWKVLNNSTLQKEKLSLMVSVCIGGVSQEVSLEDIKLRFTMKNSFFGSSIVGLGSLRQLMHRLASVKSAYALVNQRLGKTCSISFDFMGGFT